MARKRPSGDVPDDPEVVVPVAPTAPVVVPSKAKSLPDGYAWVELLDGNGQFFERVPMTAGEDKQFVIFYQGKHWRHVSTNPDGGTWQYMV